MCIYFNSGRLFAITRFFFLFGEKGDTPAHVMNHATHSFGGAALTSRGKIRKGLCRVREAEKLIVLLG